MTSNFAFLQNEFPVLSNFGELAESIIILIQILV